MVIFDVNESLVVVMLKLRFFADSKALSVSLAFTKKNTINRKKMERR
jgi:hypothetical protein